MSSKNSFAFANVAAGIFSFGLLVTTSLTSPAQAASTDAQTGWAINRVSSAVSGSYCTMAQKYKDQSVVTIAKNPNGEYSMAFEFVKPVFKAGQSTPVSVRAVGGAAQKFNVTPQTNNLAVIGVGSGDTFIQSIKSSGKVELEVSGQTYGFNTAKISSAIDELSNCTASMKAGGATAVASAAPVAAPSSISGNQAEILDLQTENAKLKMALIDARKSFENAQMSNAQGAVVTELQTKVSMLEQENTALKSKSSGAPQNAQALEQSNAALSQAKAALAAAEQKAQTLQLQLIQAQSQQQSNVSAGAQLATLQKENTDLKLQLDAANQTIGKVRAESELAAKSQGTAIELQKSMTALAAERDALKSQLANAQQTSAQQTQSLSQAEDLKKTAIALTSERDSLKAQLAQANDQLAKISAQPVIPKVDTAQLTQIQQQNADLKTRLDAANQEVGKLQATLEVAQKTPAMPVPSAARVDISAQKENDALKQEIAKLSEQLKIAQSTPAGNAPFSSNAAPAVDTAKMAALETENADLKAKLSGQAKAQDANATDKELRNQLELAEKENATLKNQLAELEGKQDKSQIKNVGNNWDLEQATRRYQESQREIRRLGALVEQQGTKCKQEKKEIEAMLFDPAVAKSAQVALYNSMEGRIGDLEDQIRTAGMIPVQATQTIDPSALADVTPAAGAEPAMQSASLPVPQGAVTNKAMAAQVAPVIAENLDDNAPFIQVEKQDKNKQLAQVDAPRTLEPKKEEPKREDVKQDKPVGMVVSPRVFVNFQTQKDFANMLIAAGVTTKEGVRPMAGASTDTYKAFRWKTDSLFGSAEQRAMKDEGQFQAAIDQYLSRAKTRCAGDFAAMPADLGNANGQGYEIACIGGKTNTSAAVLFSYNDGIMTTIAHEGKSEAMNLAMEARDRIASQMGSFKTASR